MIRECLAPFDDASISVLVVVLAAVVVVLGVVLVALAPLQRALWTEGTEGLYKRDVSLSTL